VGLGRILFSRDGGVGVAPVAGSRPSRYGGGLADAGNFALSRDPGCRVRAARPDLGRIAPETRRSGGDWSRADDEW
jgi:hypothetical protein